MQHFAWRAAVTLFSSQPQIAKGEPLDARSVVGRRCAILAYSGKCGLARYLDPNRTGVVAPRTGHVVEDQKKVTVDWCYAVECPADAPRSCSLHRIRDVIDSTGVGRGKAAEQGADVARRVDCRADAVIGHAVRAAGRRPSIAGPSLSRTRSAHRRPDLDRFA